MNLQAVLAKTDKGAEEIETRKYKLEQKLRTILIVVNGKSTAAELAKKFEPLGDVGPMLERLLAEGYVREAGGAAAPAADFKALRAGLARAITDALGPGGDALTERIEGCASFEELRAFVKDRRAVLEAALGRKGGAFWAKAASLL
jgi:hypothetical protein